MDSVANFCKFETKFPCIVGETDLLVWDFLPKNSFRFVILQKNWHTAVKSLLRAKFSRLNTFYFPELHYNKESI